MSRFAGVAACGGEAMAVTDAQVSLPYDARCPSR